MDKIEKEKKLRMAILRIKKNKAQVVGKRSKLNIATVAKEAGIHRSDIYRNHPNIKEQVERENTLTLKNDLHIKQEEFKNLKSKYKTVKREINELIENLKKLASINATLHTKVSQLEAEINSDNLSRLPKNAQ